MVEIPDLASGAGRGATSRSYKSDASADKRRAASSAAKTVAIPAAHIIEKGALGTGVCW
jgi:hypothetical protein